MHQVPLSITLLFAALLVAMILSLALEEKIHAKKSVIAGVFADALLFLAVFLDLVHPETVELLGLPVHLPLYIPGVDWEVIAIILGSSIFVDVTSKSGLFTWIAIRLTKASKGDPLVLLCFYGVMTVVFSAVLNNVTAMIIVGTLSGVSLARLGQGGKLLGFLMVEGLLTNVGGLLTLVSSVPNIIVGNAAGISFLDFFWPPAPTSCWRPRSPSGSAPACSASSASRPPRRRPRRREAGRRLRRERRHRVAGFFWFGAVMTAAVSSRPSPAPRSCRSSRSSASATSPWPSRSSRCCATRRPPTASTRASTGTCSASSAASSSSST